MIRQKFISSAALRPSMRVLLVPVFCVAMAAAVRADDAPAKALPDGVALKLGFNRVELRVASPYAFRLHIFPADFPTPAPSIFLEDRKQPATPFTITHGADTVGVKTTFGELRIDTKRQAWSLLDGAGATLTGWAQWNVGDFEKSRNRECMGNIGCGSGGPPNIPTPRYYGSGSIPNIGQLEETRSDSISGNGVTSLPQYWCSAGYGALMIGAEDDFPAKWQLKPAGDVEWSFRGPDADLYLAPAGKIEDWLRDQAELTGFAPVPPRWAFGYLQSRWGWKDKAYIDDTLARFRKDRLPVDAFIFDFEWYTKTPDYQVPADGKAGFTDFDWNPLLFPQPAAQLAEFAKNGLHMVGIRKPRLGSSENLAMARSKGWLLRDDSKDPTRHRNLNFPNPDARAWYAENLRKFYEAGVAGFWNDEGELRYNEYSYWNLAESNLLKQVKPDARFWSLNRAFAPGMQRFGAATWSGDISSSWGTLAKTPGQLMAYGLAGMPYTTCDIGGFNGEPTPELMARWMEAGVFFPVMRSHSEISRTPRFPWLYGPDAENAIRTALDLRYRLLPYYYSLAHENSRTAIPLMRPLMMEFPDDGKVVNRTDEWMMGSGLLAAPLLDQGGKRSVYLPKDRWFAFETNQETDGPQTIDVAKKLDEIPIYVRAGTLLPLGPVVQDTEENSTEPLELEIYPGRDGSFDLAEDDGDTLAYRRGAGRVTHFKWDEAARTLSWKSEGKYDGANRFHAIKAVLFEPAGRTEKGGELDASGLITFPRR